jgi:cyanophycinase-like exopeptidase
MDFKNKSIALRLTLSQGKNKLFFSFIILLFGLLSCHNNSSTGVENLRDQYSTGKGSIILKGNNSTDDALFDLLMQTSRLNLGGYAAIVPVNKDAWHNFTSPVYSGLQDRGLMAIYVLDPAAKSMTIKSEMVKIEGARLIIFVGQNIGELTNLPEDNPLSTALKKAFQKGATLAFIGPSAALAGDSILRKKPDLPGTYPQGRMENYRFVKGLNLLPETIIDANFSGAVYADFGELRELLSSKAMAYVGLLRPGKIIIRNDEIVNIGQHKVIWLSGKKVSKRNQWKMILPNGKARVKTE